MPIPIDVGDPGGEPVSAIHAPYQQHGIGAIRGRWRIQYIVDSEVAVRR